MATHHYWIPYNHDALHKQANRTGNYLSGPANRERMGLSPATPQGQWIDAAFFPALYRFNEAYRNWSNVAERTIVSTAVFRDAERDFKPAYRKLYTGFLKSNPLVTNVDLDDMGLPQRRSHVSNHTPPLSGSHPMADVSLQSGGRVWFRIFDSGTLRRAKPPGVHSVELRWDILDEPPKHIDDMHQTSSFTKSPFFLDFDIDRRGQHLYFVLRWENTRSQKGPWGAIKDVIIP
ncbi:MAG: hypothetical protein LBN98_00845 [Prevotellaceae bacterium]|jgi:hypothetical protein|nr:hypothetical protein [Prevotellaceae bacterium]